MAELITNGVFRAQAIFQGGSGFARDRYVNTFHFRDLENTALNPFGGDFGSFGDEIAERVREFYEETTPAGTKVSDILSPYIQRDYEIRVYDLSNTENPRPAWITEHTLPAAGGADSLPFEVAVAASYYAGRNIPRQRGRIYLGPVAGSALAADAGVPRVKPTLLTTLAEAMQRLASEGVADRTDWGVFSPTDNVCRGITAGWVDNEFDTIRSRQPRATTRTPWSAV